VPDHKRAYQRTVIFRCHPWQHEAMEMARRKVEASLPPGKRLSFNEFLLRTALDRAQALGVKIPVRRVT